MADSVSHSSSPAEVEGYISPQQQQQQPPPQDDEYQQQQQQQQQPQQQILHFSPPPDAVSPVVHHVAPGHDKSSRWSTRDDIILCDALVAQKQLGRSRGCAIFSLESWGEISEHLKGTELLSGGAEKNVAQCKARWQRLKIEYRIIKYLRQQPGFSWDEGTQMVTALPAAWDAYIEGHRDAQPWRKKSFPCYSRVAYLIEDENGNDKGETKWQRRWEAASHTPRTRSSARRAEQRQQKKLQQQQTNMAYPVAAEVVNPAPAAPSRTFSIPLSSPGAGNTINGSIGGSTGVFSIKPTAQPHAAPSVAFVTQLSPGAQAPGHYSSMHQFRLNDGNKRAGSPTGDQHSSMSKRPNTGTNANPASTSGSSSTAFPPPTVPSHTLQYTQQQHQPETYVNTYAGPPPPHAFPPGSVIYTNAPPPPGATIISMPPPPGPDGNIGTASHPIPIHTTTYPIAAPPPPPPPAPVPVPAPGPSSAPNGSAPVSVSVPTPTPTRLAQAIQTLESTEQDLNEDDFVRAVRLFQRRGEAADAYLAIQSRRARSMYLKAELREFEVAGGAGSAGSAGAGGGGGNVNVSANVNASGEDDTDSDESGIVDGEAEVDS